MISWFFKKKYGHPDLPTTAQPAPKPASTTTPSAAPSSVPSAKKPRPAVEDRPEEQAQLAAALGNDAALLVVAQTVQSLTMKLAAVQALSGEDTLRLAERHFRNQDRKVHRLAKQRLETAVQQRQGREQAQSLLARTATMLADPLLPINHVVTLDRDWQALNAELLLPEQRSQFAELRSQLDAALQARDNAEQALQRWTQQAKRQLPEWQAASLKAAEEGSADDAGLLAPAIQALRHSRPDVPSTLALDTTLAQAQEIAEQVQTRLACLAGLPAEAANAEEALTAVQTWQALPAVTHEKAAAALAQRFVQWQQRQPQAEPAVAAIAVKTPKRAPRRQAPVATAEQLLVLQTLLQQAQTAQADGQLGDMQQQLSLIQNLLDGVHAAALPAPWRASHQALLGEQAQLKGWQQWGGARARDELAAEAEALALATQPAPSVDKPPEASHGDTPADMPPAVLAAVPADSAAPQAAADNGEAEPDVAPQAASEPIPEPSPEPNPEPLHKPGAEARRRPEPKAKLNLKTHAEQIQTLRARWKELDRVGAASQTQWARFDAALHTAYEPIAAQQAAQKAARLENLAAREALLQGLLALPEPDVAAGVDWRELARTLDRFQLAWRQLGPLEHTVPSGSRAALAQRQQEALARLETPLLGAQQTAAAQREQLIARALALATSGADASPPPDAPRHVRELQGQWQEQARQLPLPRGLENALWTRFKNAIDAIFVQRDAGMAAREAEWAQNLAEREALLARLTDLAADTPVAQIERTLQEVDRAWRQAGEVSRAAGPALEQRLRAAHAAALATLNAAGQQRWWAQCDSLAQQLALCEERETAGTDLDTNALAERFAQAGVGGGACAQALAQRFAQPLGQGPKALSETQIDEVLLQLETALNMPVDAGQVDARRLLKLRALKDTLEGRAGPKQGPKLPADALAASLRQAGLSAAQRARLHALLAALRAAAPGALGLF